MYIYHLFRVGMKGRCSANWESWVECIVCATDPDDAKTIHPETSWCDNIVVAPIEYDKSWPTNLDDIKCVQIGTADSHVKRGVITAEHKSENE